ncbi:MULTISPECIES: hypothetical protein [unclassified Spiroplasma]|uniref:hypothetical protein n=1 Tax=unclassified Spiroplasma TaxID=2637901 RepID=UPI001E4B7FDD|nr:MULTISPECIES: hypothetical protein [unclassified Spiroplasma]
MSQNLLNFSTTFKHNGLSDQKIIINHNKVFKIAKLDICWTNSSAIDVMVPCKKQ